jgi:hypothetical protein
MLAGVWLTLENPASDTQPLAFSSCHQKTQRIRSPSVDGRDEKFNWYPVAPIYSQGETLWD